MLRMPTPPPNPPPTPPPNSAPAPVPVGGPADGLASVVALRELADQLEDAEVERAMRDGWTWSEVAQALGVTRQAVHRKHARRLIAAGIDMRRRHG